MHALQESRGMCASRGNVASWVVRREIARGREGMRPVPKRACANQSLKIETGKSVARQKMAELEENEAKGTGAEGLL
jgi:hypothetical protein